jgi:hypothetical protein
MNYECNNLQLNEISKKGKSGADGLDTIFKATARLTWKLVAEYFFFSGLRNKYSLCGYAYISETSSVRLGIVYFLSCHSVLALELKCAEVSRLYIKLALELNCAEVSRFCIKLALELNCAEVSRFYLSYQLFAFPFYSNIVLQIGG